MFYAAKGFEALGIACVMIGLVQGIFSASMWMELYLSLIGVAVFFIGWGMERYLARKHARSESQSTPS